MEITPFSYVSMCLNYCKSVFLTAANRLFSFFWRVDSPEQISSSVTPPCWEPHATKRPLSWMRRLYSASSHTWGQPRATRRAHVNNNNDKIYNIYFVQNRLWHLEAERGVTLFEQDVPDVQHAVHLYSEEDRGPDRTPAGVHQVRHLVSAETQCWFELEPMWMWRWRRVEFSLGPHDGWLLDILGPDPGGPVSHG